MQHCSRQCPCVHAHELPDVTRMCTPLLLLLLLLVPSAPGASSPWRAVAPMLAMIAVLPTTTAVSSMNTQSAGMGNICSGEMYNHELFKPTLPMQNTLEQLECHHRRSAAGCS
jgi:hypothetical protein